MLTILALLAGQAPAQPPIVVRMSAQEAAAVDAEMQNAEIFDRSHGMVFDPTRDADIDVTAALVRARAGGKLTMIVLGGNWCHDSRALAEHFAEDDFAAMLRPRYEVVYVDVGHRDRNLQIPARYGVTALTGTPTVLIISPDGRLLNRGTAGSWRNAASRSRQTIYSAFANFRDRQ